jgi:glucose-1-phosphate cytidylyltransferase
MIHVGNRPIVWHIMRSYAQYGFKRFVLCLGYKGEAIKEYFLHYKAMNSDLRRR